MRSWRPLKTALAALALGITVSAAYAGPASTRPAVPVCPGQSAVVLDFSVAPRVVEKRDCCTREVGYTEKDVVTEKDRRGWWLGRVDFWVNANVGRMAADLFSDSIRDHCVYRIISRGDLKYYYADKKDLLQKKFTMADKDLQKAILQLNPVSIGKELGVDKVIVGHICDSELGKAVAIGSFGSAASLSVAIFDVASGRLEFEKCYLSTRNHSTQYFHYEELAEEFTEDLRLFQRGSLAPPWRRH